MTINQIKDSRLITVVIGTLLVVGVYFLFNLNSKNTSQKNQFPQGVLALNTDKEEYLQGETVNIQMAAIGAEGNILCNANLELDIDGKKTKDIKKSSACEKDGVTYESDYSYKFVPQKTGTYDVKLTNLDTKLVTKNTFKVVSQRDLDITRKTLTRINPSKEERYAVLLIVTASKDYLGEISDIVPSGFTIPWWGPAKVEDKKISWQVDLKAGETKEFAYEYIAPKVSPEFYKLGENGEWQIVAAK